MRLLVTILTLSSLTSAFAANSPAPSGAHPRLFLTPAVLAKLTTSAATAGTAAAQYVAQCEDTLTEPAQYDSRGGYDGYYWPASAVSCAFAFKTAAANDPKKATYLAQAIKYWKASMDDDSTRGDGIGCTAARAAGGAAALASFNDCSSTTPDGSFLTITHDSHGYPMRWYGPYIALTYDWLHDEPSASSLITQSEQCLTVWSDYYKKCGYNANAVGANYNAGYVAGKTLTAVAIGSAGDGHLWTEAIDTVMKGLIIGQGLANPDAPLGSAFGSLVGGDWSEGWEYAPLSVAEYAGAAKVLEDNGVSLPEMDRWLNETALRYIYATTPDLAGLYVGEGDFGDADLNAPPAQTALSAVLLGNSSDTAASWAAYLSANQSFGNTGYPFIWDVIAQTRDVAPVDFRSQTPAPALWYLAKGIRAMFTRSSWGADAFWAVYSSAPAIESDHQKNAAGSFVFSRGKDSLIIEASRYGEPTALQSNAPTADSTNVTNPDYAPSQTSWSTADLLWARGTTDAVFAARTDFAGAFNWESDQLSEIKYAHREWVSLPEGEIVTIDRVHTVDAAHKLYVNFHTNTNKGGTHLTLSGTVASGTVGDSKVAIHTVLLAPSGTPAVSSPPVSECGGSAPYGPCDHARTAIDKYEVTVPGPFAVAVHVIDGLAAAESAADVRAITAVSIDPNGSNTDVIGAAIFRSSKQSFVVASSAIDGAAGSALTYSTPGGSAARHVVYDAPEAADGTSSVAVAAAGDRCVLTITAGSGGGFVGHPLMFGVGAATAGCVASDSTAVAAGTAPPGGGSVGTTTAGGTASSAGSNGGASGGGSSAGATTSGATATTLPKSGCHCGASDSPLAPLFGALVVLAWRRRRLRR